MKEEGYQVEHDGYCITVFSAPNYCDQMCAPTPWRMRARALAHAARIRACAAASALISSSCLLSRPCLLRGRTQTVTVNTRRPHPEALTSHVEPARDPEGRRARRGNKGAFIRFSGGDMAPAFTTYPASPHPNVRPMAYASFMGGMFGGGM